MRRAAVAALLVPVVSMGACSGGGSTSRPSAGSPGTPTVASPGVDTGSPPAVDGATSSAPDGDQVHPDVVGVELTPTADTWDVAATISSPYDSPERYADAFRVLAPDGTVLGVRELLHDHAAEQPFTRSLAGVTIPEDVEQVTVEGRDRANGWGGETVTVPVPR